jgi:hypothetical protein
MISTLLKTQLNRHLSYPDFACNNRVEWLVKRGPANKNKVITRNNQNNCGPSSLIRKSELMDDWGLDIKFH